MGKGHKPDREGWWQAIGKYARPESGAEVGREKVSWDDITFITNTMKMVDFKFKWKILFTK